MGKKVIFLHGFFAGGQCEQAQALREALGGKAEVLSPDLPLHPHDAIELIRIICDREKPDLLVGNSCGAFYAQMIAPRAGIPALLGNPSFTMSAFLNERIGEHLYKCPRADGNQTFTITAELVEEFRHIETVQFDCCSSYWRDKVWGLFGQSDTLMHGEGLFLEHYNNSVRFPGGHTPTAAEVRTWYAQLAEKILLRYPRSEVRHFRHFKGGQYHLVASALDSETCERMVVYQAEYGDCKMWVRPESMFFGQVERDGRRFERFTEYEP